MTLIWLIIKSILVALCIMGVVNVIAVSVLDVILDTNTLGVMFSVLFFVILLAWRTKDTPVEDEKDDKDNEIESEPQSSQPVQESDTNKTESDIPSKIKQLQDLLDQGIIEQDEFDSKKINLLDKI